MKRWDSARVAAAADGARILRDAAPAGAASGPLRAGIDTRTLAPGELFIGLRGERTDGGAHASEALAKGAWGVLADPDPAQAALAADPHGVVLAHPDPLHALQALAR